MQLAGGKVGSMQNGVAAVLRLFLCRKALTAKGRVLAAGACGLGFGQHVQGGRLPCLCSPRARLCGAGGDWALREAECPGWHSVCMETCTGTSI